MLSTTSTTTKREDQSIATIEEYLQRTRLEDDWNACVAVPQRTDRQWEFTGHFSNNYPIEHIDAIVIDLISAWKKRFSKGKRRDSREMMCTVTCLSFEWRSRRSWRQISRNRWFNVTFGFFAIRSAAPLAAIRFLIGRMSPLPVSETSTRTMFSSVRHGKICFGE